MESQFCEADRAGCGGKVEMLEPAEMVCVVACGLFFLTGLLTGVWKYVHIRSNKSSSAPRYVNVAHEASLSYSFACLVMLKFVELSNQSQTTKLWAAGLPILYFGGAILSYIAHGWMQDTPNQLAPPYRFGHLQLPGFVIGAAMWSLAAVEIGGFLVLFWGFLEAQNVVTVHDMMQMFM
eukprot:comp67816_c0_seq1/m.48051 comp67816_c0_seq1/g.48051  ORF comp67816_c0_seq1/g.48051 comp67816_c0_seq1/m.48051 type:complete len:179 (-) comp67816_c0_seq1:364-900(-)